MRWKAILFDLFDTLIHFDSTRVPAVEGLNNDLLGAIQHCSWRRVHELSPDTGFPEYRWAFQQMIHDMITAKRTSEREIPAVERFGRLIEALGLPPGLNRHQVRDAALEAHFALIHDTVFQPKSYRALLTSLAGRVRLGLVSNFDHDPCAQRIIDTFEMRPLMGAIAISEAIGWRKPHAALFQAAMDVLGVGPHETLFVGDTPEADVAGAQRMGMSVVWVRGSRSGYPAGVPPPDHTVESVADLAGWL